MQKGEIRMNLEEGKAVIKPLLSEKRYRHSVNVSREAVRLAKKYGADPQKAETAAARKTEQMAESGPIFNFFHIVSLSDFSLIPASLVTEKSEYK